MNAKIILLALSSTLLIPGTQFAQDSTTGNEPGCKDGNSKRKFIKKRAMHLKQIDSNQDQQISLEEAEAANAERLVENFQIIDSDGNGSLSRDELHAHAKNMRDQRQQERATSAPQ